jgi:hypothetical protein
MIWIIQRLSSLRSRSPVGVAQLWIVRHQDFHATVDQYRGQSADDAIEKKQTPSFAVGGRVGEIRFQAWPNVMTAMMM